MKGEGNQYDYGFRIYDARIGKFLSVDPLTKHYPWYTPYQFAGNNPIRFIDLDGLEPANPMSFIWGAVGFDHNPNETEARDIGIDLSIKYAQAYGETMLMAAPVEELALRGAGYLAGRAIAKYGLAKLFKPAQELFSAEKVISKTVSNTADVVKADIHNASWAQKTWGNTFSKDGKFQGAEFDDVVKQLKSGELTPKDIEIDVVVRDGNTLILNTRSSAALEKASISRDKWIVNNRTGQNKYEDMLTEQLTKNKLSSKGTDKIRRANTTDDIITK